MHTKNWGRFVIQKPRELFASNGLLKRKQGLTLTHSIYKNLQIHNATKKDRGKKNTSFLTNS